MVKFLVLSGRMAQLEVEGEVNKEIYQLGTMMYSPGSHLRK